MKQKRRKSRKPNVQEMKQLLLLNALLELAQTGQDLRGLQGQLSNEWNATKVTAPNEVEPSLESSEKRAA